MALYFLLLPFFFLIFFLNLFFIIEQEKGYKRSFPLLILMDEKMGDSSPFARA
jgi:hypothetical protein